ncbi:hypothetical protein SLEP1_g3992 [Rubroshorea leprosula]|uniref:Secreted protein n=1 Tax=Rubroshorea leprosula TaxID=152421 RepID=A0AAV5HVZ6_9ROSI|nr:hypothetical protein SLEP1_g3992 [Rubroshorea leprosula]
MEPRNSPPCWKIRICCCFLLLTAGCSCFVGVNCSVFACRRPLPPCSSGFYSWRIMVPDRSVS